jgi:hypothetical protein
VDEALAQKLVSAWHSRLRSNGSPERFGFAGQLAGSKSSLVDVTSADDVSRAAAMHVQEVTELFGKPITDESYGIVQRVLSRQIPHIYSAGFWSDVGDERAFAVPRMKADVELAKLLAEEGGNVSCPSSKRPTFQLSRRLAGLVRCHCNQLANSARYQRCAEAAGNIPGSR